MIFDSQDFSLFEFCPRRPQIERIYAPPRWPIRDAMKQAFKTGIRGIAAGESPEATVQMFIRNAANPGYTYPEKCEPYICAQDHASWLDGALRIIKEEIPAIQPLPLFEVGEHHVHVEGWSDGKQVNVFRAEANLGNRAVGWAELALLALAGDGLGNGVTVHVYRLPSIRAGRLLSPLVMGYQHPTFTNTQIRLARLYDEKEFGKNWKKIARWEIQPNPSWQEWRLGLDRDKCLPLIRETYSVSPILDANERQKIVYDIEQMCVAMERPSMFPRYRETCQSCVMSGLCHGDKESRAEFEIVGHEELARYQSRLAGKNSQNNA